MFSLLKVAFYFSFRVSHSSAYSFMPLFLLQSYFDSNRSIGSIILVSCFAYNLWLKQLSLLSLMHFSFSLTISSGHHNKIVSLSIFHLNAYLFLYHVVEIQHFMKSHALFLVTLCHIVTVPLYMSWDSSILSCYWYMSTYIIIHFLSVFRVNGIKWELFL